MTPQVTVGPAIATAIALARQRSWAHEVLSPVRLALALPSRRHRIVYGGAIDDAAGTLRLRLFCDLALSDDQREATRAAIDVMNAEAAPMVFTLRPGGTLALSIEEAFDADVSPAVSERLERRLEAAVTGLDLCRHVFLTVNWGRKTPREALESACAKAGRRR